MAKRRLRFEPLEGRLCMATLQTTINLPVGSWTPSVYRASPLFVDIFNTGKDDLIAVASGAQLVAYAENADGSASPVVSYKVPGGVADIKSTPIVVTDPTTGKKDLFAAMGRDETHNGTLEDGRVFGWDLQTGNLLPGWTNGVSTGTQPNGFTGVYGALTSGFLQGNGMPDIVATSFSSEVTAITLQGTVLWQYNNDDTIESGAVVADIDRDGTPEVIVGGDSSANPTFGFQNGGWVTVLSNTGQVKWHEQLPGEVTWSSPVVADLDNNGYLDIVIGTGLNFSYTLGGAYTAAGDYIYALDPFGNMLPGWPYHTTFTGDATPHEVLAGPAVGDLAGNGQLDIAAIDRAGYLHVIQPNGQDLPGFAGGKRIDPQLTQAQTPDDYASPVIADVTGSGRPDVIATASAFITAFDSGGNLINVGQAPDGSGGAIPEGIDIAPAVGDFDGTGALCLAVPTYDATNPTEPNRPDKVLIYQLPRSTLAPPWPFLRRTAAGDAVQRSPAYDQQYVAQAFNTLLGGQPASTTTQLYVNALNADSTNLLSTAQLIAISPPVVQAEVARVYQALLGRAPDPGALSYWPTYLQTHTYRQMEEAIASSAEFAQDARGSAGNEVIKLYQAILGRTPSQGEVNYWIATRMSPSAIASTFLNSSEFITDQFDGIIQAMFGPGSQSLIPPDDLAAYSLDTHAGVSEQVLASGVLASVGNYAATNFVASYVQNLYRDILNRDGSASDLAYWLTAVDNGTVPAGSLASDIVSSTEAKEDYIQAEFNLLLGHSADPTTLASLATYPGREAVLIFIVGSPEYYARNGGTNASFVAAAFRDLGSIAIDQNTQNAIVAQMNAGQTTSGVARGIIYSGTLYFSNLVVNQLMQYIPDEAQGVLRTGQLPVNAAGQPINPDPNLIKYFLGLYQSGLSDEQVLNVILTSPQYDSTVSFYRGLYRSLGIRY